MSNLRLENKNNKKFALLLENKTDGTFLFCSTMRLGIVTLAALALLLGTTCSPGSVTATKHDVVSYGNIIDLLFRFGSFAEIKRVMSEASIGVVSPKACDVCNSVAKMLLDYLNSGKSIQALIKLLQGVCAFFKLAGPETCNGAIDLYKVRAG
ncbi:hypothetical protein ISCGN_011784 [Ixodes scapularis]